MPTITIPSTLTPRQLEAARLFVYGLTKDEVATRLGLSTDTVKCHIRQAYIRLGVRGRRQLAAALEAYQ